MTDTPEKFYKAKVKINSQNEAEIEASLDTPWVEAVREEVIEDWLKDFEVSGFRQGKAPRHLFLERVNNQALLEEIAARALRLSYPQIVKDKELEVISPPLITVTKLAPGNPLEFQVKVAIKPAIKLPNYTQLAKDVFSTKETLEVSEEETQNALRRFHDLQKDFYSQKKEVDKALLLDLTDEFVAQLGPFENVAVFKDKVKNDLRAYKESQLKQTKREEFAEKLLEKTNFPISSLVIEEEMARFEKRLEEYLKKANLEMTTYLEQIKKSEEEFFTEEKKRAEKQWRTKLLLQAIATAEKIEPEEQALMEQVEFLARRHEGADPLDLQAFAYEALRNEKTLSFLEELASKKES